MTSSFVFCAALVFSAGAARGAAPAAARWWLTTPDTSALMAEQAPLPFVGDAGSLPTIAIDASHRFQSIDGFGFALTGGSAQVLIGMAPDRRHDLLEELFSRQAGAIGISCLRVSIGSSDLNKRTFSYDDLEPGHSDPHLERFSMSDDREDVIPILLEILAINPSIKIIGSPWSAPTWMKTNGNIQGGMLRESCYPAYAAYFVKYIQGMASNGIVIDAVTVQNEPFNDLNTPSMQMFAKQEAAFIRDDLGPAFRAAGLRTKIIVYDHNCDAPQYSVSILSDPRANPYVDGSGFHLYEGSITALSIVHDRFPDKNIYFTEQAVGFGGGFDLSWPMSQVIIGATRNWSRNVILWNLASDPEFKPHTDNGGCASCQGALTIDGDAVERKLAYYVLAHASRFVPPGSVRIASTDSAVLPNVAFTTPDGHTVVIAVNTGTVLARFALAEEGRAIRAALGPGAAATFEW